VRTAALHDGELILVRPMTEADEGLLEAAFASLSEDARYKRFLTPKPVLSHAEAHYMCCVDHHDHEAYCAIDPGSGDLVAEARYIRCTDRPGVAEFAITVADAWQGRGLGTILLARLVERAREEGIDRFYVLMLASNHEMLGLMHHLGPLCVLGMDSGAMQAEARIDDPCPSEAQPAAPIERTGELATQTS
jgi:GNAT superfamily N-acetyltransferase